MDTVLAAHASNQAEDEDTPSNMVHICLSVQLDELSFCIISEINKKTNFLHVTVIIVRM